MNQETFWRLGESILKRDPHLENEAYDAIVVPSLAKMRGGNSTAWGQDGWFNAVDSMRLDPPSTDTAFPVPVFCPTWYPMETDPRNGNVLRFFYREAWIDLMPPKEPSKITFTVPYVVMAEALQRVEFMLNNVRVPHKVAPHENSCGRVEILVPSELMTLMARAVSLSLRIRTDIAAIPMLMHPGSIDKRPLSFAITPPVVESV